MSAAIIETKKKKGFRRRTFVPWPEEKMRVPEAFLNCVGFLVEPISLQDGGVTYEMEGTAFLVSIPSETAPFHLGMPGSPLKLAAPVQPTLRCLSPFDKLRFGRHQSF